MAGNPQKIFVALPVMNEMDYLPWFIACLKDQSVNHFKLIACVNQHDEWWEDERKVLICRDNSEAISYLHGISDFPVEVVDRSSKGNGWKGKDFGVGWARKTAMDRINVQADNEDLMISLDADTFFNPQYFQSVADNLKRNPGAVALSVPYYHRLTGDEVKDRAILRYEIYMRYYAINLWRIGSPYNFTAIGSAIALPIRSFRAVGGITPHKSGEDFYFVQKLRKYGRVVTWNAEKVYPAARYSDRVFFGTGPAMIKGVNGDWKSYPIYPYGFFDEVKQTNDIFSELFSKNVPTPMDDFIKEKFQGKNIWQPLRENFRTEEKFVRACHHKLDALRILQFLKWRNTRSKILDEENLLLWLERFYPEKLSDLKFDPGLFTFSGNPVVQLDQLRNVLVNIEDSFQKKNHERRK